MAQIVTISSLQTSESWNVCMFSEFFGPALKLLNSPLQGSFFTRNSSKAIQPPPTRTITVLRKIRTRRSCWESPNCGGGRKTARGCVKNVCEHCLRGEPQAMQHWKSNWFGESILFQTVKLLFIIFVELDLPCKKKKRKESSCLLQDWFPLRVAQIHTNRIKTQKQIFSFHSQWHKSHKGQSNWFPL